jgi:hypothetical protein
LNQVDKLGACDLGSLTVIADGLLPLQPETRSGFPEVANMTQVGRAMTDKSKMSGNYQEEAVTHI